MSPLLNRIRRAIRRAIRGSELTLNFWEKAAKSPDPYSVICAGWDEKKFNTKRESIIFHPTVKLNKDLVVLDLCCGLGRLARFIAPNIKKYIGVDFSPTMIEKAKARHQNLSNVEFIINDGLTLKEIPSTTVDLVFCEIAFQHMQKASTISYVKEVHRILKDNGFFLAQIPRLDYYKDVYAFTKKETAKLFANYAKTEYLQYYLNSDEFGEAYFFVKASK
ncbi:MAG: class I SAM-dependent methyltransferase [Candidatus Bathyarchaeota archaeon]